MLQISQQSIIRPLDVIVVISYKSVVSYCKKLRPIYSFFLLEMYAMSRKRGAVPPPLPVPYSSRVVVS